MRRTRGYTEQKLLTCLESMKIVLNNNSNITEFVIPIHIEQVSITFCVAIVT